MTLEWPKSLAMVSKRTAFPFLCTSNALQSVFEKYIFDPFLVAKQPIFKACCYFGVAEMACNGLKMRSCKLFRHPKRFRTPFWKITFLTHL